MLINGFNFTSQTRPLKQKCRGLVLSFRFLDADKRAWVGLQSGNNYRAVVIRTVKSHIYFKMCHIWFGARVTATNFHFGKSLICPLNNICQVINRAFPVNYHGSKKLLRLQKSLKRSEMYKQSLLCGKIDPMYLLFFP